LCRLSRLQDAAYNAFLEAKREDCQSSWCAVLCATIVLLGVHTNVSSSDGCMFVLVRFRFYLLYMCISLFGYTFYAFFLIVFCCCCTIWFCSLQFLARDVIYTSRAYAMMPVRLSVRLSVTEVHWRIIANLGFKFRSHFTPHWPPCCCGRRPCERIISHHASQC